MPGRPAPPWVVLGCLLAGVLAVLALAGCGTGGDGDAAPASSPAPVGGPPAGSAPGRVVAAFLGDSYTVGLGSSTGDGYVATVAEQMGWTPVNAGQSGTGYVVPGTLEGTAPYLARVPIVAAQRPDVVVVQGSTNDVGSPAEEVRRAAGEVYAALRAQLPGARVVVVGPTVPPDVDAAGAAEVRDALAAAAEEAGLTFLDPIAEDWLPSAELYADGIHPTDDGHAEFADRLVADLRDRGF